MTALGDLTGPEAERLAAAGARLAVSVGSTEQHGPLLPLSTDTDFAVALAVGLAARREDVVERAGDASPWRLRAGAADAWDDLSAVELDIRHEGLVCKAAHAVFQVEASRAEGGEVCCDLLGDGFW